MRFASPPGSLRRSALVLAAIVSLVGWACTTDQPKKSDAGGTDAGAHDDSATDAGNDVATPDGDAGSELAPIPLVEAQVDAGHMGDAKIHVVDGHAPVKNGGPDTIQTKVFNRLLVKVADKDMPPQQLQAFVEEKTGQKLEKVRKTAGTFWLLQFAPVQPARNKASQEQLIKKLKDTNAFAVVEGDQVMTLKTP